jgi:tRNA-dependent cyclodipeptide synthase
VKSDSHFENLDLPSISIVRTTPKISEEQLFTYKRCYIGISLDNPGFHGKSLQALLLWGIGNFDQCLVVVGDYLRRFNEQIFNGLNPEEAVKVAHESGDSFMRITSEFFQQIPPRRLVLTRWEPCLQSDEYKKAKVILDELYTSDSAFRASVERDAFAFVRRQTRQNRRPAVSMEEAIEFSCRYLLEEITVFCALSNQGWKVELYPGPELHVLVDIAKGKYLRIPQGLKERTNVELRIAGGKADRL